MKTAVLIRFTLLEYYRATGFTCEAFMACLFVFLFSDQYWLLKASDIYLGLGIYALCSMFLTTVRIIGRETNPRIYILLTKDISRRSYLVAKLAAVFIIYFISIALLLLLAYRFCDISSDFHFWEAFARLAPIYLAALLCAVITVFFSKLVYDNIIAAVVLLIFSFAQPPCFINYLLPPLQQLIKMSYTGFSPYKTLYLLWSVVFISLFFIASVKVFDGRELNFDKN